MTLLARTATALVVLAALAAPASAEMITVATNADIRSTNPGVNRDDNTDAVILHTVEGLVAYREDGTVGPLLAERVETTQDGRSYTFHLRQGVKFHNGEEMTAADVVFSLNRMYQATFPPYPVLFMSTALRMTQIDGARAVEASLSPRARLYLLNALEVDGLGCGGIPPWSSQGPAGCSLAAMERNRLASGQAAANANRMRETVSVTRAPSLRSLSRSVANSALPR